jgi:hypothetical protein
MVLVRFLKLDNGWWVLLPSISNHNGFLQKNGNMLPGPSSKRSMSFGHLPELKPCHLITDSSNLTHQLVTAPIVPC